MRKETYFFLIDLFYLDKWVLLILLSEIEIKIMIVEVGTEHLINTERILKGGKLTLRDSIRRHVLKTSQCNRGRPLKMDKSIEIKEP